MVFLGAISSAKTIARVLATLCMLCFDTGGMQLYEGRAALSTGGGAAARKSKADKLNPRLFPSLLSTCQLRFQIRKLGGNFATKFASSFQSSNFDCKHLFIVGVEITVQSPMHILLH
jgi:hypothetical protein